MEKSLAVEFTREVLQALVVIWLFTQTRIGSFAGRRRARFENRNPRLNNNHRTSYILIEVVGFVLVGVVAALLAAKARPGSLTLLLVST